MARRQEKVEGKAESKKRRGKGEGCISQRKDKTWCAVVVAGINPSNGKAKQVFYYGKTRREVAEKLTKALSEQQNGVFIAPEKMKMESWLDKWLNERMKNHLRPTTWDSYKYLIDKHIKPALGNLLLRNITSTHLHDLYNESQSSRRRRCGYLARRR